VQLRVFLPFCLGLIAPPGLSHHVVILVTLFLPVEA
jgi:hypothetical protein